MNNIVYYVYMTSIFVLMFIFQLMMPKLTRKEIYFGVRIDGVEKENFNLDKIYKSFVKTNLLITLPYMVLIILLFNKNFNEWIYSFGLIGMILISTLLYYIAHKRVKKIKNENNWTENKKQVVIANISTIKDRKNKVLISAWWFIIPLIIILINIYLSLKQYNVLPEKIPIHWDMSGNVNGWANKSYKTLLLMPITQMIMIIIMFLSYKSIGWAKRQISATNPEQSLERDRIFRRATSAFIIGTSIIINLMFTFINLVVIQMLTVSTKIMLIVTLLPIILILVIAIIISIKIGQGGSRIKLKKSSKENPTIINKNDDVYWKLGLFYVNKNDSSIFVEKRFGIGYTLNFGRIESYLIIGGILALILLSIFLSV